MITAIGDVLREAYKRGWITTRDGNVSVRRGNDFYISPSGVRKVNVFPETVLKAKVFGDILTWETVAGARPSGEIEMHRMLQTVGFGRKARSVLHLHPTYILAAIHAGWDLQRLAKEFPEVSRYTKVGPTVRDLPVTSKILAQETLIAMTDYTHETLEFDIVGQTSHGICAIGYSPWDAFEHVERLEHICKIVLLSGIKPPEEYDDQD